MILKWALLAPIFLFLLSCSTQEPTKFNKLISSGQCDEASLNIPNFKIQKTTEEVLSYAGTGVSYVLTGGAYGVDMVYFMTGGIIVPFALCSPVLTVPGNGRALEACVDLVHSGLKKTDLALDESLGNKVYEDTSSWRCPDLNFAVDDLVRISDCHLSQGNREKALEQLQNIRDPDTIGGCLSVKNQKLLDKKIGLLEGTGGEG